MNDIERLSQSKWECKYHIVFIPKCRRKVLYGTLRRQLESVLRELVGRKQCQVEDGHLMQDHVHMWCRFLPITPSLRWSAM
jgi:putative transposase